jgi:hypothetical protein
VAAERPKSEEFGKGMGGKGMGTREEKDEEVKQNDGGRIMKMGHAGERVG